MNIFEKASRQRLRFNSPRGLLTVEDLWNLKLTASNDGCDLNSIGKDLYTRIKDATTPDFVSAEPTVASTTMERLQLSLDIVKHIIAVRQAESRTAEEDAVRTSRRARLDDLIRSKEEHALAARPIEELIAMRDEI